jgi:hypothetical protein
MKLYTETYESPEKVKDTIQSLFQQNIERMITKYVVDKNTQQTHRSFIILLNDLDSSIVFDIKNNKKYNNISFHIPDKFMIPPLYIPSIHFSVNLYELFESFFGHDYIYKVIKVEKKMDEDGNVPVILFFNQSLPRTESIKNFYLDMYRSKYGYTHELETHFGGTEIVHIYPYKRV